MSSQAIPHPTDHSTRRRPATAVGSALVCACLFAATVPAPAVATETKETTAQFGVTGGTLTFSTAPTLPASLGTVTIKGEAQTTHASMNNFAAQDATGTGSGWNVAVEGQTGTGKSAVFKQFCPEAACGTVGYVSGGFELPANSLTLNSTSASFVAEKESTGTAPVFVCASGCPMDHATKEKIAHAEVSAGMGTWTTSGFTATSLSLNTPTTLKALPAHEVYQVNLLWTLSTGP
jgi:WxL domain surface cell wall-binding